MKNTKVKICGIMDKETAVAAAEAGADLLGMVFAVSKRKVTPEQASLIANEVRKTKNRPRITGVFVNTPASDINKIAEDIGLDMVQLSGDESPACCKEVIRPVIKVIHVTGGSTPQKILREMESYGKIEGLVFMLDTQIDGQYGGTGRTFDPVIAKEAAMRFQIFIAGGLTSENVGGLIKEIRPLGVDVSGGVETNGRKDIGKIERFIMAARDNGLKR